MSDPANESPQGESTIATTGADGTGEKSSPLAAFGFALAAFALAGYLFYFFSNCEAGNGCGKIWWVAALVYNLAGKWPIVGILGLLGVVSIASGVSDLLKKSK